MNIGRALFEKKKMTEKLEGCSIGLHLQEQCHKTSYVKKAGLVQADELDAEEIETLLLRTGLGEAGFDSVCLHHKCVYLVRYELMQIKCCDPYKVHKTNRPIKKHLRAIDLSLTRRAYQKNLKLIPGKKICSNCIKKLNATIQNDSTSTGSEDFSETSACEDIISVQRETDRLNASLLDMGQSPIKVHSMPPHMRTSYGKRKLDKLHSRCRQSISKALRIEQNDIVPCEETSTSGNSDSGKKILEDATALHDLMEKLKAKIAKPETTRTEKIQMLTLVPLAWSREKVMTYFDVSQNMVKTARSLLKDHGILALPEPRKGKCLDPSVADKVLKFYCDDEFTRMMPGMSDRVSISKNVYKQKRLILCTLKELYAAFREKHPDAKVSFSKFCTLRPKWCVTAGSSGTHSVCVCTLHQNVSLLMDAAHLEESYHDLINLLTCESSNRDCMLLRCGSCPNEDWLKIFLHEKFEDLEDTITFKEWTAVDRTELITRQLTVTEYIDLLVEKMIKLIPHSYIAKQQSKYLKNRKEDLGTSSALVLLDFSENYRYRFQDEVQGYHWSHSSCTVHPAVCYYKNQNNELQNINFCFLSDYMQHDVAFVYALQSNLIGILKSKLPSLKSIEYFSDGCAAQYKNCKNFLNLCMHKFDFDIDASWSFFATSHGKSPCDGIGGTVKRSTAMESLRRPFRNQIGSVESMMSHCKEALPAIQCVELTRECIELTNEKLQERFALASTIKGTRAFHYFKPDSSTKISMKRTSNDEAFAHTCTFAAPSITAPALSVGKFVAAVYDRKWYIGIISQLDSDTGDVFIKFMQPNGPSNAFFWPKHEDECWIPNAHILCVVDSPNLASTRGQYSFPKETIQFICGIWNSRC